MNNSKVLSWIVSAHFHLLVKVILVLLIHTLACLNDTKTKTKYVKDTKMVGFIKICYQYPNKLNVSHFFSSFIVSFPSRPLSGGQWLFQGLRGSGQKTSVGTFCKKFLVTKLFFKLSFVKILMPELCALWQMMNHFSVFFTLMSPTGKGIFFNLFNFFIIFFYKFI